MAHINLLPWREERREQRQREFFIALGVAVAVAITCLYVAYSVVDSAINQQTQRNSFLQTEIAKLDHKIREISQLERSRDRLIARMQVIQELQESRPKVVKVFDALPRSIPEGIHLETIARQGARLVLDGVAQSNARVSVLMRELEANSEFDEPRLRVIQRTATRDDAIRRFTLEVAETKASDEGDI
ncbi:type IV pilus biogenesis protein PilN [Methylophaga lonarensis MPL]|uniref:Type IV pilus biogenesis protein PilN n=1 Tax=Methylophaga lonarensis MPL TaxID=1286106 RepID=M7PTZ6_9GAMM|nr:PilN domain-containing protein [Methylophaga lonarensis]EMR13939.1 type IV pilus biogenesis protein PilN [Methylophaga lonarensis MPL]